MRTVKNRVFTNATIVTLLSVAERGLGFLYRIVLSRLIGAEGVGLYQVSLSLFSFFLTIGTGGLPITVSRMITKSKAENDPRGESRAVTAGIVLSLLLTLPAFLVFGFFGDKFGFLFSDERCFNVFRILLLGLSITSVYAVFRGSFWGNKQFLLPSVLELAEEAVMVIAGVLLLQNVDSAATGAEKAAWAVVVSYVFSFIASALCFFFRGGKFSKPKNTLKPLFNATLPITSVRASGSLVNSAIAVLLPAMLIRAGYGETEALKQFGIVSGMAMPILFIPSTIIGSIALVLMPELTEDFYTKNLQRLRKNIRRGLKFALLVACVLLPFFYALGEDIGKIAFSNSEAGVLIRKNALILLPMSLTMISTSALNSMGFVKQTFLYYFIGAAVMLLCILLLPPICGVYAYTIGLGASYVITALCNLIFLQKTCHIFTKQRGQVRDHGVFIIVFAVLPLSLLGQFCNEFFKRFFGEFSVFLLTAAILGVVTAILYVATGILPLKNILQGFKSQKKQKT